MIRNCTPPKFFPSPQPDEVIGSVVSRYNCLSGNRSGKYTLCQVFGCETPVTFTGLPSRLSKLFSRLPTEWLASTSELIDQHTILPYFRPFLTETQALRTVDQMLSPNGSGIKTGIGLPASRVGAADNPRYCLKCAEKDRAKIGTPYWRRSHQLPGVYVCHLHGEELVEVKNVANHPCRHRLHLPLDGSIQEQGCCNVSLSVAQKEILHTVASMSHDLMESNLGPLSQQNILLAYKERLAEMGFITSNGRVRQSDFNEYISAHFSAITTLYPYNHLLANMNSETSWVASILRKPRKSKHPLKHLLVIAAIFPSINNFVVSVSSPCQHVSSPALRDGSVCIDPFRLRELVENDKLSLREISVILGTSVTTLSIQAKIMGIELQRKRPVRHGANAEKYALKLLRKGVRFKDITRTLSMSVSYLNRLLRTSPKTAYHRKNSLFRSERRQRRQSMMQHIQSLQNASRSEVRKVASCDCTWLYRHDNAWLQTVLPQKHARFSPKIRVDWQARDTQTAKAVVQAAENLKKEIGKPFRISRSTLARAAGVLHVTEEHMQKLPKTKECIDSYAESVEDFQVRRVRFYEKILRQNGKQCLPWEIKRAAGLPSEISLRVKNVITETVGFFQNK